MFPGAKRALYVFLCGIMGSLLLSIIQKSIFLIYLILLSFNPDVFSFGLYPSDIANLDTFSLFLALAGGGWYGVWLGLHWYDVVYQKRTFPGIRSHLAEVFNPKNLKIQLPTKGTSNLKSGSKYTDFWKIEDLPKESLLNKNPDEKVVTIKPKRSVGSVDTLNSKKPTAKKVSTPSAKKTVKKVSEKVVANI